MHWPERCRRRGDGTFGLCPGAVRHWKRPVVWRTIVTHIEEALHGEHEGTSCRRDGCERGNWPSERGWPSPARGAPLLADVDVDRGEEVVAEVAELGADACFTPTDVADAASVAAMVDATMKRFGRLDYAFNNAGIEGAEAPTGECTIDNWSPW